VLRRVFWFGTGATAGFGAAMWVRRQVLRTVRRYTPERVQADVSTSVRRLGTDLRAAVTEGRAAMADREVELRSALAPGGDGATGRGDSARVNGGPDPGDRRDDHRRTRRARTDAGRTPTSPLG
jgi:hypothetical protein